MKKFLCLYILFGTAFSLVAQNLAFQKTVTVSSSESSALLGPRAVDGNTTTRWASDRSDPQWFSVDLNANFNINRVVIHWEASSLNHVKFLFYKYEALFE